MVTSATSFARSGLTDFIIQRVTAVILGVYAVMVFLFFYQSPDLSHAALTGYFGSLGMQIFSTAAIACTVAHAWIGLWTVGTDYIRPAHVGGMATSLRFIYQMICVFMLFVYLVWAIRLIWTL